jgi:cyclopropane fatty-acyl-phospholipid synthase-like methyltransferase
MHPDGSERMIEEYVTNPEYQNYYPKLGGLRQRIAITLPVQPGMSILDVATGEGFFAIEVAKRKSSLKVTGIEITQTGIRDFKKNVKREGLSEQVEVVKMDATQMSFGQEEFDMAVTFTGLEDIHMTRGKAGVERTFHEVNRVLKPGRFFCFVVMPPDEMETEAQRIEVALFSHICDATWLSTGEYRGMLEGAGFRLIQKQNYYTGKKLTTEQAKREIQFAIKNDPKIYGITTPSFEEVWAKFGQQIEKHGLGHYSKVVLMVAQRKN